ncbi:nickel-type superoxide dismutase maturation protease [Streptomyces meridianus]|uniref:Nickel-type superoxide dismutase maturation protease n=1 Tax=Streptomyces meridianus TaxID=2938945 RepID=A0ABT0X1Q7_9ACTN|nr:nickel-type superoxide dismutase maturation protease [Streptomyces meridianus]MCM2576095.1 nickel-type superoxide dismutase maturation protease [Streptomyces meridianus]
MPEGGRWQQDETDAQRVTEHGAEPGRSALPFGIAEVVGPSMAPALLPGDRLVVQYGTSPRPGDVVVLRHPMQQDLLIVKRAVERREGGWWVLGDNRFVENDSREFGVVPDGFVLARAWLRLRPPQAPGDRRPAALLTWALSAVRPVPSFSPRSLLRRRRAR